MMGLTEEGEAGFRCRGMRTDKRRFCNIKTPSHL
jgi:hypothetical protein